MVAYRTGLVEPDADVHMRPNASRPPRPEIRLGAGKPHSKDFRVCSNARRPKVDRGMLLFLARYQFIDRGIMPCGSFCTSRQLLRSALSVSCRIWRPSRSMKSGRLTATCEL